MRVRYFGCWGARLLFRFGDSGVRLREWCSGGAKVCAAVAEWVLADMGWVRDNRELPPNGLVGKKWQIWVLLLE